MLAAPIAAVCMIFPGRAMWSVARAFDALIGAEEGGKPRRGDPPICPKRPLPVQSGGAFFIKIRTAPRRGQFQFIRLFFAI